MNQDLRRKLNRITDILWAGGVTNPVTYIEQISYLIYLKLLDEEESSRELKARLMGNRPTACLPRKARRRQATANCSTRNRPSVSVGPSGVSRAA